jgi:hypothetical protein
MRQRQEINNQKAFRMYFYMADPAPSLAEGGACTSALPNSTLHLEDHVHLFTERRSYAAPSQLCNPNPAISGTTISR